MSRSATALNEIMERRYASPVHVIRIQWSTLSTEDTFHSNGVYSWSGNLTRNDLLAVSPITYKKVNRHSVIVGTVSITLIDTNLQYYTRLKTLRLAQASVTIYLSDKKIVSAATSDYITVFSGKVVSPINYDEAARTLTFEVIPSINSKQIPFSASEDGTTDADKEVDKQYQGVGFCTPFGKVVDAPATLVREPKVVRLVTSIDQLQTTSFDVETDPLDDPVPFENPTTERLYYLNREAIKGKFGSNANAKRFTITGRNQVVEQATTTTRPSNSVDPDADLANVVYLGSNKMLVGLYCENTTTTNTTDKPASPKFYNYCYKQVGSKCWFTQGWVTSAGSNRKLKNNITLKGTAFVPGSAYTHPQGAVLRQANNLRKTYVFSDTPLGSDSNSDVNDSEVVRVRAYRNVPVLGGPEKSQTSRVLVRVPQEYYTINRNANGFAHALNGAANHKANTIVFEPPLSERFQGWEDDQIFVSLRTDFTTGSERNPTDQIQYILERYTDLTPDSTSFAAAKNLVSGFDSDIVLTQPKDAFQVCADIAWQARCGLAILGNTVKIKYLSVDDPLTAYDGPEINASNIVLNSLSVAYTELEDVVTVFRARYSETYTSSPSLYIVRTNTSIFPEKAEDFNFNIYQRKVLVKRSADFWAGRYGNIWKLLRCTCLLQGHRFEPLDFVQVNLTHVQDDSAAILLGQATFRGVIEELSEKDDGTVDLLIWTPILAGTDAKQLGGWGAPSTVTSVDPLANSWMTGITSGDIPAIREESAGV